MSMVEKAAPKDIDRDTVLAELLHRFEEEDPSHALAWVLDTLADLDVLRFRGPVDDPSKDLIGTVRREDHTDDDGYTTWQVWANQYGDRTWRVSWSASPVARSFLRRDYQMVGCPVIGAAPGTPAGEEASRPVPLSEIFPPEVFQ